MKLSVLGCGRWGTFLAAYGRDRGHEVVLYGRPSSERFRSLVSAGENEYMAISKDVRLSSNLEEAVSHGKMILIAVDSQGLRELASQIHALSNPGKTFVLCMKGLEEGTGKRMSQVFAEETGLDESIAVWAGPGHVQDFLRGIPNCMVLSACVPSVTREIANWLSSGLIRFYFSRDLIGVEIGAAAKNVIGIAGGILDGLGYSSLKGALMARGAREISRLVQTLGGEEKTVYGLSHLGDYEATLFSPHSHNRQVGESLVSGEVPQGLAEGVKTAAALIVLSEQTGVELPICRSVLGILREGTDPRKALLDLFLRPLREEF